MMYAAAGQCFCYLIITVLIRYNELPGYPASKQVASASVAFFFLYYIFFGIGFQGVPWLYPTARFFPLSTTDCVSVLEQQC